jgi:hypothetical protein
VTRKEARRRLAAALREQRTAREEVRGANARVVEATSKLPPHYVDEHRRFAPGERDRIQALIDRAQKASDRLATATADVVNLRRLVGAGAARPKKTSPADLRHHATKKRKTPKQLDREIAQSLASSGQPKLADLFADPAATKTFAREMRHEIQKKQTSQKTAAALAARPYTVKRLEDGRRALFGRYATEAEARAVADKQRGWVEHGSEVIYGHPPSDHATRRRSHASISQRPSWKEIGEDYKRRAKAANRRPKGLLLALPK